MSSGFIPKHGGYKNLKSYQKAELIYDITFRFCNRFFSKGDRTVDQMIQGARSGKQNIVEGAQASGTSKKTEVFLLGVARGSLEELLADYRDYLRVRDLATWPKDSRQAQFIRDLGKRTSDFEEYREFCETRSDEVIANIAMCLIHQANFLLDQQIRRIEQDFIKEGGLSERMSRARREELRKRRPEQQ